MDCSRARLLHTVAFGDCILNYILTLTRFKEIFIHGLGAAINRAINLALQLKETSVIPMEVTCNLLRVH